MKRPIPRFALTREEAAQALGMGLTSFDEYVQPEVRMIRKGRLRLVPCTDLEKWADRNASKLFSGDGRKVA